MAIDIGIVDCVKIKKSTITHHPGILSHELFFIINGFWFWECPNFNFIFIAFT